MTETTNLTIAFPNWFWVILSFGVIGIVFYLGGLHAKITQICQKFPKIEITLVRISEILLQKGLTDDFVFTQSPVKLTPEGEKAVKDAGFPEFYSTNKTLLIDRIKHQKPTSMADLEQACKNIMTTMEDSVPKFDLLEHYAYSNGIPIAKILFACAIALRDLVAKELPVAE